MGDSIDPPLVQSDAESIFSYVEGESQRSERLSAEEFMDLVVRSKLADQHKVESLYASFINRAADKKVEAEEIAELLIQGKLLTPWQVTLLKSGRFRGFFLGKYKLLDALLPGGNMGDIYLAEHVRMHRRAALKILPQRFVDDKKRLDLFFKECEATAALDHPNIVRAYDVDNDGSMYYLVMEYVDGQNLEQIVQKDGPIHYATAMEYVRQVADGLAHAHDLGIIHRDIKPSNLMLDVSKRIKILDLGLSYWENIDASPIESSGKVSGTPAFMSPEQCQQGTRIDSRSDIYSLGCTAYYLLTGDFPFSPSSIMGSMVKRQNERPPGLCDAGIEVPEDLEEIYQRMTAVSPEDRFSSAQELRDSISRWQKTTVIPVDIKSDSEEAEESTRPRRILIADDDEYVRLMLSQQLKNAGYEVIVACDGQEAMDLTDSEISVCLFDLKMPRATGMDCLRFVNSHFDNIPVIILSGSDEIQNAVVAMREGAFDYLTKPCKVNNLLMRVETAVRTRDCATEDVQSLKSLMTTIDHEQRT